MIRVFGMFVQPTYYIYRFNIHLLVSNLLTHDNSSLMAALGYLKRKDWRGSFKAVVLLNLNENVDHPFVLLFEPLISKVVELGSS